jgi:hypothetical protein
VKLLLLIKALLTVKMMKSVYVKVEKSIGDENWNKNSAEALLAFMWLLIHMSTVGVVHKTQLDFP